MTTVTDRARETLVRALDELDGAIADLGHEPERVDVVVTYSLGYADDAGAWRDVGGWACTPGPKWAHAALLTRAADAQADAAHAVDDEDGLDDEGGA